MPGCAVRQLGPGLHPCFPPCFPPSFPHPISIVRTWSREHHSSLRFPPKLRLQATHKREASGVEEGKAPRHTPAADLQCAAIRHVCCQCNGQRAILHTRRLQS